MAECIVAVDYFMSYFFTCVTLVSVYPVFNLVETHGIVNDIIVIISFIKVDEVGCIWVSLQHFYY